MDNKMDVAQLMNMLSKMDKKELDANLSKDSKMLNSKDADNIIVLKNGRIVEQGKHVSLISQKGIYYELVKNQLEI